MYDRVEGRLARTVWKIRLRPKIVILLINITHSINQSMPGTWRYEITTRTGWPRVTKQCTDLTLSGLTCLRSLTFVVCDASKKLQPD